MRLLRLRFLNRRISISLAFIFCVHTHHHTQIAYKINNSKVNRFDCLVIYAFSLVRRPAFAGISPVQQDSWRLPWLPSWPFSSRSSPAYAPRVSSRPVYMPQLAAPRRRQRASHICNPCTSPESPVFALISSLSFFPMILTVFSGRTPDPVP